MTQVYITQNEDMEDTPQITKSIEEYIYDASFVEDIKEAGFNYVLPEKTLGLINRIARMVGAPSYIKTPIFHKNNKVRRNNGNGNRNHKGKNNHKGKHNKKKSPKPLTDDEWETLRTFEETKLRQISEGIEKDIALVTTQLNKLTNDTYDVCSEELCDIMDRLMKVAEKDDVLRVCNSIFKISSSNGFYSRVFAKILSKLINTYSMMKDVFYENYENFMSYFESFEYVNPDEDYDAFCELNRENERRRAYAKCVANLVCEGIISTDEIIKHIAMLVHKFKLTIDEEKRNYVAEQITEIIFAIVSECYDTIKTHDDFTEFVYNDIKQMSKMKRRDYTSLSSKCIFKMMDLIDIMK